MTFMMKCKDCGAEFPTETLLKTATCGSCGGTVAPVAAAVDPGGDPKPKSMYRVSFDVEFDIGYADGVRRKITDIFGAFNVYSLEIKENRGK